MADKAAPEEEVEEVEEVENENENENEDEEDEDAGTANEDAKSETPAKEEKATPPKTPSAKDKLKAAEDKASAKPTPLDDLKRERAKRRTAETELRRLKAESATGDDKIRNEAKTEEQARWKTMIARSAVRSALSEAGAPSKGLDRLAKLVDIEALDVSDDGEVDGLTTAVESLETDYPELFGKVEEEVVEEKTKAPKISASGKTSVEKPKSAAEKIAQMLTASRGA